MKKILLYTVIIVLLAGCIKEQSKKINPLPSSAEILFLSNMDTGSQGREIYSMSADGSNVTRITYTGGYYRLLGIDVTRRYIVVTKKDRDTGKKSLWLIDLRKGEEKRLTDPENNAEGDSFSPDGEWIVFYMTLSDESQSDIYKIRIDGTSLTRLTYTDDMEADPCWSNDGSKIAFISYSGEIKRFVLKIMDQDGRNMRTIYDCRDNISTKYFPPGAYDPSWSPDDQWIVFEKPVKGNEENAGAGVWHIFKIRSDGTDLIDLREGGHTGMAEYLPSFSADGEFILFSARYDSQIDIFIMDKNGGSLKKLTDKPSYEEFAIWIK